MTKIERFDEDVMHAMVKDDRFSKKDRFRLSEYNKKRRNGGEQLVVYGFGKEVASHKLGRLYPQYGIGLQSYRWDMRNPLAAKHYWDIDVENAHYCIAETYCKRFGIKHDSISHYVNNRNECLSMVSSNRKKAKTEFLKVLYGGDIKLYNEDYEEIDGVTKQEGNDILYRIKNEMDELSDKLWKVNPEYHSIKTIKDGKMQALSKVYNGKYSLLSILFQTEERKLIMYFDYLLLINGRQMDIPIHDGGYVKKLENETEFPQGLLHFCSHEMTKKFNCNIRVTQKQIVHYYEIPQVKKSVYEDEKEKFEKEYYYVGDTFLKILGNGEFEYVNERNLNTRMSNVTFEDEWEDSSGKKRTRIVPFLSKWLSDPKRKRYERADFIPDRKSCPDNVYNLFNGFAAEKIDRDEVLKEETPITPQARINNEMRAIFAIRRHIGYITGGYVDPFLKYCAHIVQHPERKTEMNILLRDTGGFMAEGGGTGKNVFLEWFGNEILGEKYTYVVGDNKELYGAFNSQFESKLLVIVEEAQSKENHENFDILKARTTCQKLNINKKNVPVYSVRDKTNTIFCSNNRNPLPTRQGNRRIQAFDCDVSMRGDTAYFTKLVALLKKPSTKYYFFNYLKKYKTYDSPIMFQTNIPKTKVYRELRYLNAPKHFKWLASRIKDGLLEDGTMTTLMKDYD
ncbi:MAG: hypothetical protein EOO46_18760, partial [Flavobacterium sp.]